MSYNDRNRGAKEKECEESVLQNGSIATPQLTIDENLLVDPKQLFIGSIIGEGAHGKVYEGRSVAQSQLRKYYISLSLLVVNSCDYILVRRTVMVLKQ